MSQTHTFLFTHAHTVHHILGIFVHTKRKKIMVFVYGILLTLKTTCTVSILRFKPIASAAIQHLIT